MEVVDMKRMLINEFLQAHICKRGIIVSSLLSECRISANPFIPLTLLVFEEKQARRRTSCKEER